MYKKLTNNQRIGKTERQTVAAKAVQERLAADLDYIAMMCEVELEPEAEEQEEDHDEV